MNLLKCAVEVINVSIYSISIDKSVGCVRDFSLFGYF